jgi:glycosyltransferase involved in cell wall biosynthesis
MAKLAICTVAYNESEYIEKCIEKWKGKVDKHLVLVSTRPWNGEPQEYDGTAELAKKAGAEVIIRYWRTEAEQRNWGLAYLYDYDYVLIIDPDEFYIEEDQQKILKALENPTIEGKKTPVFVPKEMVTYWKTTDYIFDPADKHKPTIAIDPKKGTFLQHRCPQPFDGSVPFLEPVGRIDVTCHHFSWVHSDKKVEEKIQSYSHTDVIPTNWYEDVWLKWEPNSNIQIRPYGVEQSTAKYSPAPKEIL